MKKQIEIIQLIRFLAAAGIYIYHCQFGIFENKGYFGVELFFIISGFILMYSTERRRVSAGSFLMNRIVRIVPLYWILTIATWFLIMVAPWVSIMSEAKLEYLVKSLFFLPFVNGKGYDVPIIGVGWTLNYEMFFYLIVALGIRISYKYRGILASLACVFLVVLGRVLSSEQFFIRYYTNLILMEFVYGIVLYYIWNAVSTKTCACTKWVKYAAGLLAAGLYVLLWTDQVTQYFAGTWTRAVTVGLPAFFMVLLLLLFWGEQKIPSVVVTLGNISYSFFLLEYFTSGVFKAAYARMNAPWMGYGLLIVLLGVTCGMSYISYILIEKRKL